MSPIILNPYRYATGAATSTPDVIFGSDLVAWYRRGVGVYDQVSGGSLLTAASTDNTEVGRWEDQSGNGYHATRNGLISFGHLWWRTDALYLGCGQLYWNFAAADPQWFVIPNAVGTAMSGAGKGALFVTYKLDANDNESGPWDFGTDAFGSAIDYSDHNIYDNFGTSSRHVWSRGTTDLATWGIYNTYSQANDWQAFWNNASIFSTLTNTVGFKTSNIMIGSSHSGVFPKARIAEVVLVKNIPTSGQRAAYQTYATT